jgi:hypothetical protein
VGTAWFVGSQPTLLNSWNVGCMVSLCEDIPMQDDVRPVSVIRSGQDVRVALGESSQLQQLRTGAHMVSHNAMKMYGGVEVQPLHGVKWPKAG